jgi:hypothetical protein
MGTNYQDQRTDGQKKTHTILVTAKDKFLSGWGMAQNGSSYCAWAVNPNEASCTKLFQWVNNRSEMKYVNIRYDGGKNWRPNAAHVSIYAIDANHPSQK